MENTNETNKEREIVDKQPKIRRQERTTSQYVLPSNRHGFNVQFDILRRFVTLGRTGVAASDIEGEGVPVQAASMNVRFMRSIGLLGVTERGVYIPTPETVQFINARSASEERAKPILAAVISKTWFAELAQTVFNTQPLMSEDSFIVELALAAHTDRVKEQMALKTLLDYLIYTGIVTKDERGLSLGTMLKPNAPEIKQIEVPSLNLAPQNEIKQLDKTTTETPGWHILQTEDFYLKVKSDPNAIEDLKEHLDTLKKKIERLRNPP